MEYLISKFNNELISGFQSAQTNGGKSFKSNIYHIVINSNRKKYNVLSNFVGSNTIIISSPQSFAYELSKVDNNQLKIIRKKFLILNKNVNFNQLILGFKLSKTVDWKVLITIKMKYLLSEEISINLKKIFLRIEKNFFYKKLSELSITEKLIISFMKTLASWDINLSMLIIDSRFISLKTTEGVLIFRSILQLSSKVKIFICDHKVLNFCSNHV